jgi:hypothetical protein
MERALLRSLGAIVSFGSVSRCVIFDRLIAAALIWLPKLAPMSLALLNAPLPTAVQLLARAGRRMPKR